MDDESARSLADLRFERNSNDSQRYRAGINTPSHTLPPPVVSARGTSITSTENDNEFKNVAARAATQASTGSVDNIDVEKTSRAILEAFRVVGPRLALTNDEKKEMMDILKSTMQNIESPTTSSTKTTTKEETQKKNKMYAIGLLVLIVGFIVYRSKQSQTIKNQSKPVSPISETAI